jgi:hypothetical protein
MSELSLNYSDDTARFARLLTTEGAEQSSRAGEEGEVLSNPPIQHGIGASRPEGNARIQSFQVRQYTGTDYSVWSSALQLNLNAP